MSRMPMMACGCVATLVNQEGEPSCFTHYDTKEGRTVDASLEAKLEGRMATCDRYGQRSHGCGWNASEAHKWEPRPEEMNEKACACKTDSDPDLPFFVYRPDRDTDQFYCGCAPYGWD